MLFPFVIVRPLLFTSVLLNCHRCWELLKATSLYMEIGQMDVTKAHLPIFDNLDQTDVQPAGRMANQIH